MNNVKKGIRNLKIRATATAKGSKRVVRGVWYLKMRKLAIQSKMRRDNPDKESEVVPTTASQNLFINPMADLDTDVNSIGGALIIDEYVDIDALCAAVETVRRNNDGLRIQSVEEGGIRKQFAAAYEPLKTQLMLFKKEEELKQYCDLELGKAPGDITHKDLNSGITLFQLGDGRAGIIIKEHHSRQDAESIGLLGVYVLDVYEHRKKGDTRYQGAKTSFIHHAKTNPDEIGSIDVPNVDYFDTSSTTSTFLLSKEKTDQIDAFCEKIGEDTGLNMRASKVFEFAESIYIARRYGNAEVVTLQNLSTGRTLGTSDEDTIGLYMNCRPAKVFVDKKRTIKENLIDMKQRAKGILGEPGYLSESDPSDTIAISFRSIPDELQTLIETRFHTYEVYRKHMTVPLFLTIDSMNNPGQYKMIRDFWNNRYTARRIEDRQNEVMSIVDFMLKGPEMTVEQLLSNLELLHPVDETNYLYAEPERMQKTPVEG